MAKSSSSAKNGRADSGSNSSQEWEHHYANWSERVFRYLIHLVGSPEAAEDLFQETWMKGLDQRHQLSTQDNFGPWILRIARNLAFNSMRSRNRRGQVIMFRSLVSGNEEKAGDPTESQPSSDPSPYEQAISAQRREIILGAIGRLDQLTQEMLQLRYFEELTLAEIAQTLDVPLGTVCTKVHRGLKSIRVHLRRRGFRKLDEI